MFSGLFPVPEFDNLSPILMNLGRIWMGFKGSNRGEMPLKGVKRVSSGVKIQPFLSSFAADLSSQYSPISSPVRLSQFDRIWHNKNNFVYQGAQLILGAFSSMRAIRDAKQLAGIILPQKLSRFTDNYSDTQGYTIPRKSDISGHPCWNCIFHNHSFRWHSVTRKI